MVIFTCSPHLSNILGVMPFASWIFAKSNINLTPNQHFWSHTAFFGSPHSSHRNKHVKMLSYSLWHSVSFQASAYQISSLFFVKWHSLETSMVSLKANIWVSLPRFPNSTSEDTVSILKTRFSSEQHITASGTGASYWLCFHEISWILWWTLLAMHFCQISLPKLNEQFFCLSLDFKILRFIFHQSQACLLTMSRWSQRAKICGLKSSIKVHYPTVLWFAKQRGRPAYLFFIFCRPDQSLFGPTLLFFQGLFGSLY